MYERNKTGVLFFCNIVMVNIHEGSIWVIVNILCLDLGGDFTSGFTLKKSLIFVHFVCFIFLQKTFIKI